MNYQELLRSPILPTQIAALTVKAARNNAPVLIQGEKGTGKEMIAKIIHHTSDWKYYRFYTVDCNILTEDSLNDQLSRLLKETNSGTIPATLYLKAVGSLGQSDQLKLLELIEDGVFQNGVEKKVIHNWRFISSSPEDLKEKVVRGKFSEDLYYRLNTLSILVPPLRERAKEFSAIAQYVLADHSKKLNLKKKGISKNVLTLLQNYWWPGNLKELEHVIVRSAIFSESEIIMEKDLFFETENERNSFHDFLRKAEITPPPLQRGTPAGEQNHNSLPVFLMELVHRIKNPLVSIKTFTQLLREKFNDVEFREYFYKIVTQDIEKIDSVLNGLLNYIRINTPLKKTDTVHFILEDVLRKNGAQFENKKIKIFKKYEKDLPETVMHDEQLRYIFHSLLQYALPSIPPNGSIGLLTKTLQSQTDGNGKKTLSRKDERCIEIMMVFTGYKKSPDQFESVLGIRTLQHEEPIELELRLIKEMIQKNRGTMTLEVNEKKPRTLISLTFPIERRNVMYYPSTNG